MTPAFSSDRVGYLVPGKAHGAWLAKAAESLASASPDELDGLRNRLASGNLTEDQQRVVVRALMRRTPESPELASLLETLLRGAPLPVRLDILSEAGTALRLESSLIGLQLESAWTPLARVAAEILTQHTGGPAVIQAWISRLIAKEQPAGAHEAEVLRACMALGHQIHNGPALLQWLKRNAQAANEQEAAAWMNVAAAMPKGWFADTSAVTPFSAARGGDEPPVRTTYIQLRTFREVVDRVAAVPPGRAPASFANMVADSDGRALPILQGVAQRRELPPEVLVAAATELAKSMDVSYVPTLVGLFYHPSEAVQQAAVRGVAGYGEQLALASGAVIGDDLAEAHIDTFTKVMAGEPVPESWSPSQPWTGETAPPNEEEMLRMSVTGHIHELFSRVVAVSVTLISLFWAGYYFAVPLADFALRHVYQLSPLEVIPPPAGLLRTLVGIAVSMWLGGPMLVWQAWKFSLPGLYPGERRLGARFVRALMVAIVFGPAVITLVAFGLSAYAASGESVVRAANAISIGLLFAAVCYFGAGPAWARVTQAIVRNRQLRLLAGGALDDDPPEMSAPGLIRLWVLATGVLVVAAPLSWLLVITAGWILRALLLGAMKVAIHWATLRVPEYPRWRMAAAETLAGGAGPALWNGACTAVAAAALLMAVPGEAVWGARVRLWTEGGVVLFLVHQTAGLVWEIVAARSRLTSVALGFQLVAWCAVAALAAANHAGMITGPMCILCAVGCLTVAIGLLSGRHRNWPLLGLLIGVGAVVASLPVVVLGGMVWCSAFTAVPLLLMLAQMWLQGRRSAVTELFQIRSFFLDAKSLKGAIRDAEAS